METLLSAIAAGTGVIAFGMLGTSFSRGFVAGRIFSVILYALAGTCLAANVVKIAMGYNLVLPIGYIVILSALFIASRIVYRRRKKRAKLAAPRHTFEAGQKVDWAETATDMPEEYGAGPFNIESAEVLASDYTIITIRTSDGKIHPFSSTWFKPRVDDPSNGSEGEV